MKTNTEILDAFKSVIVKAREKAINYDEVVYTIAESEVITFARALAATAPESAPADATATGEFQRIARMANDFPRLSEFHTKYALGPMLAPSCLCCGQQTHPLKRPVAIKHGELPGIVICTECRDKTIVTHPAPSQSADQVRDAARLRGQADGLKAALFVCENVLDELCRTGEAEKEHGARMVKTALQSVTPSEHGFMTTFATSSAAKGKEA